MRFALMVTGPAYGTQQASSALQFAHALLDAGHELASVFFIAKAYITRTSLRLRRAMSLTSCAPGKN